MFIEIRKIKRLQKAGTRTCHAKQWPTPPSEGERKASWRCIFWAQSLRGIPMAVAHVVGHECLQITGRSLLILLSLYDTSCF